MERWCRIFIGGVILVFSVLVYNACAQEPSAEAIMDKVFTRYDGDDAYSKVEMTLSDKKGYERKRQLEIYTKDYGKLIKTYIKFTEPADIRGTAFLSIEKEGKDNTQYLYLPALGRARRIVSSQKNLRFVNTDFTYEDMQRRRPDKDGHKLLGEEVYNDFSCYVVENIPKRGTSQYSKRISWIDKKSFVAVKIEFYDKKGNLFKRLTVSRLEETGGIWTAMDILMENLKDRHKTRMRVLGVFYNQGLDDEIFTLRNLEDY